MRKIFVWLTLFAMLFAVTVSAQAATTAKSVSTHATVTHDGKCQVTLTANIHLDQPVSGLRFPLPEKARNITVNGARATGRVQDGLRQVDISRIIGKTAGDFTLTFTYNLPNLVKTNDAGLLELQLPMLAGFAYPVQSLEFSVTLPGTVTAKPAFTSGYHQANIEKDMYWTTSGATITGIAQTELKDHETLTMSLLVSEEMFPQSRFVAPDFETVNVLITVFSLLALVYWLIFLRNLPQWPHRRATAPEGYTAGEMGTVLHLQGGNLHTMVFSWAQLGYVQIHLQPGGKVKLEKRMDMGNERSSFEQKCFRMLFGRQNMVDTTTLRYAGSCRDIGKMRPNFGDLVKKKTGNLKMFRYLAAGAGLFYGVSLAIALSAGAALQWLLIILLGAAAAFSAYHIQSWGYALLSAEKRRLWIALVLCGLWIGLSAAAGMASAGFGFAAGQLFAGLLLALGGRRTTAGKQAMAEAMGLGRYLAGVNAQQMLLICRNNPDYFHQMMPYAIALGVDKRFAKGFGKLPIGPCPYISIGTESTMRATQWRSIYRRVLGAMSAREQNLWLENIARFIQSYRR